MRGGFYIRLAGSGITKNRKLYIPYIITCICMVMMFYIIAYLGLSADFGNVRGGDMMQSFLLLGIWIIAVFSLIFLYYTNSFLIRRRQKEFGLYNILGMGKRNLVKILIWENILTAVISLGGGLVFGILFSKLAELAGTKMLGGETGFAIHVALQPIVLTVVWFLVIFALILLRMLFYIFRLRPVEMLKSENVGEKPPKTNWVLALIGVLLLAAAYYMAVAILDPMAAMTMFFVAVVMVIIATYLLFIAGSVAMCRLLQRNKNYYYKTKHFVSLSSMVYRMKRNGAGLASICILSTMALVTVGSTICLYVQTEDGLNKRYPSDIMIEFSSADQSETEEYRKTIDEVLADYGAAAENTEDFYLLSVAGMQTEDQIWLSEVSLNESGFAGNVYEKIRMLYITTLDDYNKMSGENRELQDGEALLCTPGTEYNYDTVTIENCGTWQVEKLDSQPFAVGSAQAGVAGSMFLIVKDMPTLIEIQDQRNAMTYDYTDMSVTFIEENYNFDLSCGNDTEIEIYSTILERLNELPEDMPNFYISSKAYSRADYVGLNGGLFFLGILLGSVFLFGTVLIIYYKQISEGYEDQDRFNILMKVGMTRKEVRQSINSQMLTVFFMPLLVAGLHLAFAFPLISKILQLIFTTEEYLLIIGMICCYLVFALFYVIIYAITSKSYYGIVSGKEKR